MLAPWLLLMLALPTSSAPELRAAASVTPRPLACQPVKGVWARAKAHARRQHCATLAKALLGLERDPKAAIEALLPLLEGELGVEALVATARAKLALGDARAAWADFNAARARSPSALSDPLAQHDAANAAAAVAEPSEAAAAYRLLIAARELLPQQRRVRLLLEAALAVLRLGPENIEEATEYLRLAVEPNAQPQGRRERELYAFAAARTGRAVGNLELQCAPASEQTPPSALQQPLPEFEEHALRALACESTDRQIAREQWQHYAAADAAKPWRSWAEKRGAGGPTSDSLGLAKPSGARAVPSPAAASRKER